jgi:hypothetical protein
MQAAWSVAQRRLHWAMAGLVFVNFLLALVMVALPLSALFAKILTYQLHKSLGFGPGGFGFWGGVVGLCLSRCLAGSRVRHGWGRACFMRYSSPCQCWVS